MSMRIVVYGDSLTAGYQLGSEESYASKLSRKLRTIGYTDLEVYNMGDVGHTSSSALKGINEVLARYPDVVVLQIGNSDIWRGINASLIRRNLEKIMSELKSRGVYVVLLGSKVTALPDSAYAKKISGMYQGFARSPGVGFYPYVLDGIAGNPGLTLADGFHPNNKGMELMVENTYRLVDAGIRQRWNDRQQDEYDRQIQQQLPAGSAPSGAVVTPEGVVPRALSRKKQ